MLQESMQAKQARRPLESMASPSRHALPPARPRHHHSLSSTVVDESVAAAAVLVEKWHPDDDSKSLFLDGAGEDYYEPQRFLRAAADLHRAMLFFASDDDVSNDDARHGLVQAQALLQTAMRRLDQELQLLLLHIDDDDESTATASSGSSSGSTSNKKKLEDDLRAVAEAMMAAGYGKECISTFKSRRRAALATKLQRLLGFPLLSSPRRRPDELQHMLLHKLTWEQLDGSIIPSWVNAATVAFNSLFPAEKHLCDAAFAASSIDIGEAVFAAVANEQATGLLAVAEAAVARAARRRAPERLFRVLDVHHTLATEVLPALSPPSSSVFGAAADAEAISARAALLVVKAREAARATLEGLEAAIHKEPSKATAPGGAVHPLTRYLINYLVFLADYHHQEEEEEDDDEMTTTMVIHHHRLVRALEGKLEAKAGSYRRHVALSYLFLANNTHYMAKKVDGSAKLRGILGEGWPEAQRGKARAHVEVYVRAAWGKVMAAAVDGGEAAEAAVMEAVGMQEEWVAADEEMGRALRAAATAAVVPKYRMFYRKYGAKVNLTPGDVTAMIAALFAT